MEIERRYTPKRVETRNEETRTIGGYAAVFDSPSSNLGGFIEVVGRQAFDYSSSKGFPGVLARYNHEDNYLLGTSDAGTLRLGISDVGLTYEVDVPNSREDVRELVARGDVDKSSFAFRIREDGDEWNYDEEREIVLRTIHSLELFDVAPVNTPAYPSATVGLRSLANAHSADIADIEKLASENKLKRLFKRSDEAPKTILGSVALSIVLGKNQAKA